MSKWTDPDVIRQMEAVAKEKPLTHFEIAMAEAHRNAASSDPGTAIPGKVMAVVMPLFEEMDEAVRERDGEKTADIIEGLCNAMAMLNLCMETRLPGDASPIIRMRIEQQMRRIKLKIEREVEND